jgi:hypothetical protein
VDVREQARESSLIPRLEAYTVEAGRELCRTHGVDFATALLYQRLIDSPVQGTFVRHIDNRRQIPASSRLPAFVLAVAPGAFYREFPHTGADGRMLIEEGRSLGMSACQVPCESMGTVNENAAVLVDWLARQGDAPIILASVSKGGADVERAMEGPQAERAFRNVKAWINLAGLVGGSQRVNQFLANPLRALLYRGLFRLKGLRFQVVSDLKRQTNRPPASIPLPPQMLAIHVVGFPLTEHLTAPLTRNSHRHLSRLGPNDGAILLAEVCRLPGLVYPVWGADHYLRPAWELRSLARALLLYAADCLTKAAPRGLSADRSDATALPLETVP